MNDKFSLFSGRHGLKHSFSLAGGRNTRNKLCFPFFYLYIAFGISLHTYQVRGNYYIGIHKLGAGSRWRRTTGQEIYSPLLLAFTHEVWLKYSYLLHGPIIITILHLLRYVIVQNLENWKSSHLTKGTILEPNYSLPPNVALITLEVGQMQHINAIALLTLSNSIVFVGVGWWNCASPFGTSIWGKSITIIIILLAFTFWWTKQN